MVCQVRKNEYDESWVLDCMFILDFFPITNTFSFSFPFFSLYLDMAEMMKNMGGMGGMPGGEEEEGDSDDDDLPDLEGAE